LATSGTVSQTVFETRKVIDHAFRRCKIAPQQITSEYLETASDLLYLILSTLASRGVALWCIDQQVLGMYEGQQTVDLPAGTIDVLNVNLRKTDRITATAYSSSSGTTANAFDGDVDTLCTLVAAAGNITVNFSATQITTIGLLYGATGTWDVTIQTSTDGLTWATRYANTALGATDGQWTWIDLEGIPSDTGAVRIVAGATTILSLREFVVANNPLEVPLAAVNRDQYSNLSNRFFRSRPTEFWYDKKRSPSELKLWPVPSAEYTFWQLVNYVQRNPQDVGTLTQELDIPQRWYLAIICELAKELAAEIPEVKPEVMVEVAGMANARMNEAWSSESDGSPMQILPNISPYTR